MHEALVALIEKVIHSISDNLDFVYGRTSDFKQDNDRSTPTAAMDPPTSNGTFTPEGFNKTWNISMAFYKLNREDSNEDEYRLILNETDAY